jgi:hypothetical protein
MLPQAPYTEVRHETPTPPPVYQGGVGAGPQYPQYQSVLYDEQFIEALAQRLIPRLKSYSPVPTAGQRLALLITSLALMIPMIAILMGITVLGFWGILIGLAVICVTVISVNAIFATGIGTSPATPAH